MGKCKHAPILNPFSQPFTRKCMLEAPYSTVALHACTLSMHGARSTAACGIKQIYKILQHITRQPCNPLYYRIPRNFGTCTIIIVKVRNEETSRCTLVWPRIVANSSLCFATFNQLMNGRFVLFDHSRDL